MNTENLKLKNCIIIALHKRICYNFYGDGNEEKYFN